MSVVSACCQEAVRRKHKLCDMFYKLYGNLHGKQKLAEGVGLHSLVVSLTCCTVKHISCVLNSSSGAINLADTSTTMILSL